MTHDSSSRNHPVRSSWSGAWRRGRAIVALALGVSTAAGCTSGAPPDEQPVASADQALGGIATRVWTPEQFPRQGHLECSEETATTSQWFCANANFLAIRADGTYGVAMYPRHGRVTPAGKFFWDTYPYFRDSSYAGNSFALAALGNHELGAPGDPQHRVIDRRHVPTDADLTLMLFRTDPAWLATAGGVPEALREPTGLPAFEPGGRQVLVSVGDYGHQGAIYGFDPTHRRSVDVRLKTDFFLPAWRAEAEGYANEPANHGYDPIDAAGNVLRCDAQWDPVVAESSEACALGGDSGGGLWSPDGKSLYAILRNKWQFDEYTTYNGANAIGYYPAQTAFIERFIDTYTGHGAVQVQGLLGARILAGDGPTVTFYAAFGTGTPRKLCTVNARQPAGNCVGRGPGGSLLAVSSANGHADAPFHIYLEYRTPAGDTHPLRVYFPRFDLRGSGRQAAFYVDALGSTYWADAARSGITSLRSPLLQPLAAVTRNLDEAGGSRAETQAEVGGTVTANGAPAGGVEVTAFLSGTPVGPSTPPVAVAFSAGDDDDQDDDGDGGSGAPPPGSYRMSLPIEEAYGLVDADGVPFESLTYDLYVRAPGKKIRALAAERVVAEKVNPIDLVLGESAIHFFPRYLVLGPYQGGGCAPASEDMALDWLCDGITHQSSFEPSPGATLGLPDASCAASFQSLLAAPEGQRFFYSGSGDNLDRFMYKAFDLSPGSSLSAKVRYIIEPDYDYAYLVVSTDGGATWTSVETSHSTSGDPNGKNLGWGITGWNIDDATNGDWTDLFADLSPFAGDDVLVGFRYRTDRSVAELGFMVDAIEITGHATEGAEPGLTGWTLDGFITEDGHRQSVYLGSGITPTVTLADATRTSLDFNQVYFNAVNDPIHNLVTYAWVYVENLDAVPRQYVLGLASDDGIEVSLNHQVISSVRWCRGSQIAGSIQNHVPVTLQPGVNLFGFKVFDGAWGWNMRARLEDASGHPLTTAQIRLSWTP